MRDDVGRFRVGIYRQRHSLTLAVRNLSNAILKLEEFNFPTFVSDALLTQKGLVLVTSPAGHGKSSTLAAMIDYLNRSVALNIITLEDPIEFLHKHKRSNVNQREVGEDTESFASGLAHILRQNPDVIMIGDLRNEETISAAIHAASTGHLVIASMHGMNTIATLETLLTVFSGREAHTARQRLADCLLLSIAQRLVPRSSGSGRILAYEILRNSPRNSTLIREGKPHQIRSQATSGGGDFLPLDTCLTAYLRQGFITEEDAVQNSESGRAFLEAFLK